ncbi:MAG TPA: HlyD family secretion protein [Anaeromyxobacteraceae bacterium]|jgi:membrane fusion protein (multidrug efflux system)|nr:HlyD family secretion protein [Anaeromyxobacteraceae bacterium]
MKNTAQHPIPDDAPRGQEPLRPVEATPAPSPEPGKKDRRKPFLILGALTAAVLLGLGLYLFLTAGQENTDDAQVEADVVPTAPRVGGQVLQVSVAENQAVKKGDLILAIDPADYEARAAQAHAELRIAQAQADAAEAQERVSGATATGGFATAEAAVSGSSVAVANADAQVAAARAGLVRAEADARKSGLDLARAKQLLAARAVPQQALDNAQAADDSAQAALTQARAQVRAAEEGKRAAESRVGEARGRLAQSRPVSAQLAAAHAAAELARARVQGAQASAKLADLQLSYTRVLASEDGVVSKLGVHEGQIVQPGQPVIELVPAKSYVLANFKETQIGRMKPGQKVEITVDAFPGKKFEGRVESLSGGTGARFALLPPDNASGNFVKVVQRLPVRIAWEKPPEVKLAAGLSADVTVYTK